MLKVLTNNINGKIYNAIESMYVNTSSAIKINNKQSVVYITSGMRQGDVLSTTLFNIYINDLAKEIKYLNIGISIGELKVSILLYADDLVLLAESEKDLQRVLDKLNKWCLKWKMQVNQSKSNVVHFRKKVQPRTNVSYTLGNVDLKLVDRYRYLGIVFNEYLDFNVCVDAL